MTLRTSNPGPIPGLPTDSHAINALPSILDPYRDTSVGLQTGFDRRRRLLSRTCHHRVAFTAAVAADGRGSNTVCHQRIRHRVSTSPRQLLVVRRATETVGIADDVDGRRIVFAVNVVRDAGDDLPALGRE